MRFPQLHLLGNQLIGGGTGGEARSTGRAPITPGENSRGYIHRVLPPRKPWRVERRRAGLIRFPTAAPPDSRMDVDVEDP